MHGFLFGLAHATLIAIVGFFVLFAASKASGLLKLVGNVLGLWLFALAVLAIAAGAIWGPSIGGPGWRMMGYRHGWEAPPGAAPAVTPAPAPASNAATPAAK